MLEDRVLVWRCKQGRPEAFRRVYEKYEGDLVNLAAHLLRDPNLAEDVIQDVFVGFAGSIKEFRLTGSLKAYLSTCVINRTRDYQRARQRRPETALDAAEQTCADTPGPIELVVAGEQKERIRRALEQIPDQQREVIALHLQGGLRFRQIAQFQKTPLGTVLSRYRYGLEKLRTQLNGEVAE